MNSRRRILSIAALVMFALTLLITPWRLSGSPNDPDTIKFAPLLFPPHMGPWTLRELSSGLFWSWLAIGIFYILLYAILGERKNTLNEKSDEQTPHA
jgi:hypothetical protein